MARSTYSVRAGEIFRDGKKIGTVSADGVYQIVDPSGKLQTGSITELITENARNALVSASGAHQGPTGKLRVHTTTYEVVGGSVFFNQKSIGTIDGSGNFDIRPAGGTPRSGNAFAQPGVVWLGGTAMSAKVTVGTHSFTAVEGVIYEHGQAIGWLNANGLFRGVTARGDYFEGSVHEPDECRYFRFVESSP